MLKGHWNLLVKKVILDVWKSQQRHISIQDDPVFEQARKAKAVKRRQLQSDLTKHTINAVPFPPEEKRKIIDLHNEETPEGLLKKFFQYASFIFAWRGNEGAKSMITHYREEKDLRGIPTGRIEYNPIFTKTCQEEEKILSSSK